MGGEGPAGERVAVPEGGLAWRLQRLSWRTRGKKGLQTPFCTGKRVGWTGSHRSVVGTKAKCALLGSLPSSVTARPQPYMVIATHQGRC